MKKHPTLKKVVIAVALLIASLRTINAMAAGPISPVASVTAPVGTPLLPTGLTVMNGNAVLNQTGSNLKITTSPNSVLDWQKFSIGASNSVFFQQANAGSQVLNRVTGQDPSYIMGSLGSNGRVWLLNPNGVLFGANARVDVGSLVASTLTMKLPDFLSGNYQLRANGSEPANGLGVVNQGQISTPFGGQIVLAGSRVSNSGTLRAPGGNIALLGTDAVDVTDTGLPYLSF